MIATLTAIRDAIWGTPLLVLLVGTGIYLTVRLGAVQLRGLAHALHLAFVVRREEGAEGDISHFQALMTALAATVGTGNIAGVATAIAAGGPGALFWMWITGLFGMATKYSEALLSVKYREVDAYGTMSGGPMYALARGVGGPAGRALAFLFAAFAAVAAFGIGNMVQSNSVADVLRTAAGIDPRVTGAVLALATAAVILGGIRSIARVTEVLVPVMIVAYMAAGIAVLAIEWRRLPGILAMVLGSAFTGHAAVGGFLGATVKETVRMGVARGVFSNESGLGSAGIAAAAAQTTHPVAQALVSMTQTFIDTLVVCSVTGFVILASGAWTASGAGSRLTGAPLTAAGFDAALPHGLGSLVVSVGLVLFAYSTILGWSYYGEKSLEYLLGERSVRPYRIAFCVVVFVGAVQPLELVWTAADIFNGLMALPNLVGLLALSGVLAAETRAYFARTGGRAP